jgi:hypothetical protein
MKLLIILAAFPAAYATGSLIGWYVGKRWNAAFDVSDPANWDDSERDWPEVRSDG